MSQALEKLCHELASRVLELKRGLNSPQRRLELAEEIRATIDTYLAFEQRKTRLPSRKRK
ncbi:hypothetical protein JQ621_33305 [Bradyrhizobium manausense]|uniref:hypothetical protein n=1 Tax=Bradyrhizobium manausense TaxID=989370 RepID=UPI001BA808F6|nr:hypothetical protein [Bradyrhizobium manausense]MBR1092349.1 hypothetical protein [Bradyrhizobium manausense]